MNEKVRELYDLVRGQYHNQKEIVSKLDFKTKEYEVAKVVMDRMIWEMQVIRRLLI